MEETKVLKKKKMLVPKLRFKGFEESWTAAKIGDGMDLISGQHLSPFEYNTVNRGIPYFTGPSDFTDKEEEVTKWSDVSRYYGLKDDILITVKGNGVGKMSCKHWIKLLWGGN